MERDGKWQQASMSDPAPPEFSSIVAGPGGFVAASDKAGAAGASDADPCKDGEEQDDINNWGGNTN